MLIIIFLVCCVVSIVMVILNSGDEEPEPKPKPKPKPKSKSKPLPSPTTSGFSRLRVSGSSLPVDCIMTDWENVGECSTETGLQEQRRLVAREGRNGGQECPPIENRTQSINCSQDCEFSDWENVGECSTETGLQKQRRTIETPNKGLGTCKGDLEQSIDCSQDCEVGEWSGWSDCSEPCGTGTQTRTRTITKHPKGTGEPCGETTETQECKITGCDYISLDNHAFTEPIGYNPDYPDEKRSNAKFCGRDCNQSPSCSGFKLLYLKGGTYTPSGGRYWCRLIDTAGGIQSKDPTPKNNSQEYVHTVYYKEHKKGNLNIT